MDIVGLIILFVSQICFPVFAASGHPCVPFDYQVSLQRKIVSTYHEDLCIGSMIGKQFVLTAARCFFNERNETIDLDDLRVVAYTPKDFEEIIMEVQAVYIRRGYPLKKYRDIAMVKVVYKLGLFEDLHLNTIRLPPINLHLVEEEIVAMPLPTCFHYEMKKERYRYLKLKVTKLDHKTIRAVTVGKCTEEDRGSCSVNRGSPLIIFNPRPTIVGVYIQMVSEVSENIFVNVMKYFNFINATMYDTEERTGVISFPPECEKWYAKKNFRELIGSLSFKL